MNPLTHTMTVRAHPHVSFIANLSIASLRKGKGMDQLPTILSSDMGKAANDFNGSKRAASH